MSSDVKLEEIISSYTVLEDHISNCVQSREIESVSLYEYFVLKSFKFSFNGYKAIGLLLPELYHEFAFILLRTLWENSLNAHWVSKKPETRTKQFLQFTTVETNKLFKNFKWDSQIEYSQLNDILKPYLKDYEIVNKKGRIRLADNFAKSTVEERVRDLGEEWIREHEVIFRFGSLYVHASPGVIISPLTVKPATLESLIEIDSNKALMTGVWSMAVMTKIYKLFGAALNRDDSCFIEKFEYDMCLKEAFGN